MDLELKGRTAIVCGASSGLGLAVARELAGEGANVVMVARRQEVLEREAAAIGATAVVADLAIPGEELKVVEQAAAVGDGIDILVWNTGGPKPVSASELTDADLRQGADAILLPLVRTVQAALPYLKKSSAGRILAITAGGVKEPTVGMAVSNALRPGLVGYLKTLAGELAELGITVNNVAPGRIRTERLEEIFPDGPPPSLVGEIPAGRLGEPAEFAAVVCFLASGKARYVTGETVVVDGGLARSIF